jgi:hypothetical protein
MRKRVTDLSPSELEMLAREAWGAAAKKALARGLPVTGSRDGRRFRRHADGRIEDLGPVVSPSDETPASEKSKRHRQPVD